MSVKPAPIKFQKTFNVNNYFKDGSALLNSGNQRLHGSLQTTGASITYGDETVYGDSTLKDEPLVLSITDPLLLQSNNLVTKSYVDSKITLYPQIFNFGDSSNNRPEVVDIRSGYVYLRTTDTESTTNSFILKINYKITFGSNGSLIPTSDFNDIVWEAYYYVKILYITAFPNITVSLLSGQNLGTTVNISIFNQTFIPIQIGRRNGDVAVIFGFPSNKTAFPNTTNKTWVSSYGVSIKIVSSTEDLINKLSGTNTGNWYFALENNII